MLRASAWVLLARREAFSHGPDNIRSRNARRSQTANSLDQQFQQRTLRAQPVLLQSVRQVGHHVTDQGRQLFGGFLTIGDMPDIIIGHCDLRVLNLAFERPVTSGSPGCVLS